MWLKYLAISLEALRSVGKNLQSTMASIRQNIAPFIMIVAWFKVPLLQKEWVPCWMWLKCDWTWLKYSWLISIRMWLLSIKIPLQSISITINQDQSLQEFSDAQCQLHFGTKMVSVGWSGCEWLPSECKNAHFQAFPPLAPSGTFLSNRDQSYTLVCVCVCMWVWVWVGEWVETVITGCEGVA